MRRLRSELLLTVAALAALASSVAASAQDPDPAVGGGGWMGLYIRTVDRDDIEALDLDSKLRGVVVSGIDDEGPAAKAGIEPGDVITRFDGRSVENRRDFMRLLDRRAPGEEISLTVLRNNDEETVNFRLGERPRELEDRDAPLARLFGNLGGHGTARALAVGGPVLGVQTVELDNAALAEYFGAEPGRGILVTDIIEDSGAEAAGLRGGDVILGIADEDVGSVDELRAALADYDEGDEVDVRIRRQKKDQTLRVELGSADLTYSSLRVPRVPSRTWVVGDDVGDLRRELRELKRDLQRLEREMRRR